MFTWMKGYAFFFHIRNVKQKAGFVNFFLQNFITIVQCFESPVHSNHLIWETFTNRILDPWHLATNFGTFLASSRLSIIFSIISYCVRNKIITYFIHFPKETRLQNRKRLHVSSQLFPPFFQLQTHNIFLNYNSMLNTKNPTSNIGILYKLHENAMVNLSTKYVHKSAVPISIQIFSMTIRLRFYSILGKISR